ncbi:MAG: 2-dehydropantoate 2-reductase [Verrucomicrobiales bacterium]|nr:2-dehydropantoate 2-reductase [Verrucomicrobiales bacterium]
MSYRIAIVGAGAVGCYYGAHLVRAGAEVHFLMRSDLEHVAESGLSIESVSHEDFVVPEVQCHASTEEIGEVDLVVIAIKATHNEVLLELIPPLLGKETCLLTLQNGLGNGEFLAEHFGESRVMGGLCFVCLNRISPGVIKHLGFGLIMMGELCGAATDRTREVGEWFSSSGVACEVVDDLMWASWRKLVWNIPFNGLAILGGGMDVAEILADEDLQILVRQLMLEVIRTAGVLGFEIPESLVEEQVRRTLKMGPYRPSSMVDFTAGREVEVEAIWGEAWRRGEAAGAEVGRLEMMYRLIREKTRSAAV